MIIIHKRDQSFSSNKKCIIIDKVNCSMGFFQLSKELITRIKNILLSVFALENYLLSLYGASFEKFDFSANCLRMLGVSGCSKVLNCF